jgi:hypothetical protein
MRVNVRYMNIVYVKRYDRRRWLTDISENYIACTNEEAATFTVIILSLEIPQENGIKEIVKVIM